MILKILLLPLGVLFVFINYLRRKLYFIKFIKSDPLPCSVISVGNLTMGGSGKTPFCIFLAKKLESEGKKVAVVLRGYKRKTKGAVLVNENCSSIEVGEEALVYLRNLNCQIAVAEKRMDALNVLKPPVDVIILDDGFQHLKVKRDIDIVLIDGSKEEDLSPFPIGKLREPLSSLKCASLIAITKTRGVYIPPKIKKWSDKIPTIFLEYEWDDIFFPHKISLADLKEKTLLLLLGIGNPDFFVKTAQEKQLKFIRKEIFPDHFNPDDKMAKKIISIVDENKIDLILTSEKDYVKWKRFKILEPMLIYPNLSLKLFDDKKYLDKILSEVFLK
ncbi:MAG: tetraacyldisaccharide 4'-kinase [Acidobacteria bacterium]|nr:tetraacyldisaccharide 4'-kinase [Acidobacteriota bacterium]